MNWIKISDKIKLIELEDNLTKQELEERQKKLISGDQVHEILVRPYDNLRMIFNQPKLDEPHSHLREDNLVITHHKIMKKHVIEMLREAFVQLKNMKVNQHTYQIEDSPFMFKIDGYVGDDIKNLQAVVVVKIARDPDVLQMLDEGLMDEIKYYCMCLNTTRAYLAGMFASKLILNDIEFTQAELDELREKLLKYNLSKIGALRSNRYDYLDFCRKIVRKADLPEFEIGAEDQRLPLFIEMSDKFVLKNQLEKEIEDFQRTIKEIYGKSIVHWTHPKNGDRWCAETPTLYESSVNSRQIVNDIAIYYKIRDWNKIKEFQNKCRYYKAPIIQTVMKPYKEDYNIELLISPE